STRYEQQRARRCESVCLTTTFFFSSRRRHTRWPRDGVQTCALPICGRLVDAQTTLQQAGFVVSAVDQTTTDKRKDGIVLDQSPKGGDKADRGSTVTVTVGRFQSKHGHRAAGGAVAARGFV